MQVWLQGSLALELQSGDSCMVPRLEGTQKMAWEDSWGGEEEDAPKCNLDRRPQWRGGHLFLEMTPPTLLHPSFSYYQSLQHLALEGHFFPPAVYFWGEGRDWRSESLSGNESWTAGGYCSHSSSPSSVTQRGPQAARLRTA